MEGVLYDERQHILKFCKVNQEGIIKVIILRVKLDVMYS